MQRSTSTENRPGHRLRARDRRGSHLEPQGIRRHCEPDMHCWPCSSAPGGPQSSPTRHGTGGPTSSPTVSQSPAQAQDAGATGCMLPTTVTAPDSTVASDWRRHQRVHLRTFQHRTSPLAQDRPSQHLPTCKAPFRVVLDARWESCYPKATVFAARWAGSFGVGRQVPPAQAGDRPSRTMATAPVDAYCRAHHPTPESGTPCALMSEPRIPAFALVLGVGALSAVPLAPRMLRSGSPPSTATSTLCVRSERATQGT